MREAQTAILASVTVGDTARRASRSGRRTSRAVEGRAVVDFFAPEGDRDIPPGFAKNGGTQIALFYGMPGAGQCNHFLIAEPSQFHNIRLFQPAAVGHVKRY